MLQATQIKWNGAHNKWNDYKLGDLYTRYLKEEYGITVESGGRVIWNHVLNVIEIIIQQPGGAGEDYTLGKSKQKKRKKRIKLIFIMGDVRNQQEKEVSDLVPPKLVSDVTNKLEEDLKVKITLKDVQIIKG